MESETKLSIYRAARSIKRKDNTLYNALKSIYDDSIFVGEISQLWPQLLLVANLRCGLWYSPKFESTCYFKSTDGHTNNWSFNTSSLNFHTALLAGQKGGCIIVDSTRKGKRFPDSMSKTIPIWTCVLNRSVFNYMNKLSNDDASLVERKTVIWINEMPDYDSWDFTPIILLSATSSSGVIQHRTTSEFSWNYIPGAGDDKESWARGLSPNFFWNHAYDLISAGPDLCNQKVADIVEKDRVYRSQRGQNAPQISAKPSISWISRNLPCLEPLLCSDLSNLTISSDDEKCGIFWLGSTNLALSTSQVGMMYCHGRWIEIVSHVSFNPFLGCFDVGKSFDETGITKCQMRRRLVYICKFAIKSRPSRGNLKQVFSFLNCGKVT